MRSIISALLLCASTTLTSACLYERDGKNSAWSYDGRTGPLLWHTLSPEWDLCATGANQSPININSTIRTVTGSSFNYPSSADFNMLNNGHTIDSAPAAHEDATAFRATLGGEHYQLVGFHFHTQSEHMINGLAYPLEAHFVHRHVQSKSHPSAIRPRAVLTRNARSRQTSSVRNLLRHHRAPGQRLLPQDAVRGAAGG